VADAAVAAGGDPARRLLGVVVTFSWGLHAARLAVTIRADDAVIGYPPSHIFGTPTTMLWIYRLGLERAKQYLLTGCEIDAPTALRIGLVSEVHPAAELAGRVEAHAGRFRHIPANQLALNKLLINQAYENMGLRTTQLLGTLFDGVTRHTEEAYQWVESFTDKGFREVIRDRDRPWADYGERPR
jgi:enoyl-CoA hydratase